MRKNINENGKWLLVRFAHVSYLATLVYINTQPKV